MSSPGIEEPEHLVFALGGEGGAPGGPGDRLHLVPVPRPLPHLPRGPGHVPHRDLGMIKIVKLVIICQKIISK